MGQNKQYQLSRGALVFMLCLLYYFYIGLQSAVVFSSNPQQFIHHLWQLQWPGYLAITGFIAGVYLTLSATLTLGGKLVIYEQNKTYKKLIFSYGEVIVQLLWIVLPSLLIYYERDIQNLGRTYFILGLICFLSVMTLHRVRLKKAVEAL